MPQHPLLKLGQIHALSLMSHSLKFLKGCLELQQQMVCATRTRKTLLGLEQFSLTLVNKNLSLSSSLKFGGGNQRSGCSEIHVFGVTKEGHSILARVLGFEHYFYYPTPQGFSDDDLAPLRDYINASVEGSDFISQIELDKQRISCTDKFSSFLKIYLFDHRQMRRVKDFFTSGNCQYRDLFTSPERCYETTLSYPMRFMLDNRINALDWLHIPAKSYTRIKPDRALSFCQLEVSVEFTSLMVPERAPKFAPMRILSFDMECEVPPDDRFPEATHQAVVQIGNIVSTYGSITPIRSTIFTLGSCSPISGCTVYTSSTEDELLMAWRTFFVELDPDIVIGYNITQFDIPYLLTRAKTLKLKDFPFFGRMKGSYQRLEIPTPVFTKCPGYDGRLVLDVFHYIRENHHIFKGKGAYKLNAMAAYFLGEKKEVIHYTEISGLQAGGPSGRRELALYCLKDSYLALRLMQHLQCFEKEVLQAKEAHVPYNDLRVGRDSKGLIKRYNNAVEQEFIIYNEQ